MLYKIFFIDFDYYELHEEYLTVEIYRKIQHGPAPCHFNRIEDDLIKNEVIKKDIVKIQNYRTSQV